MEDDKALEEWLKRSTSKNGVPLLIEDQATIAEIAQRIKAASPDE